MSDINLYHLTNSEISLASLSNPDSLSNAIQLEFYNTNSKYASDGVRLCFDSEEHADQFLQDVATAYHQRQLFKIKQQQESEES
tara:strand:- start:1565 stop:1816 length:252 start_codon:yes stop_codon:yes gene_type:complete